MVETFGGHIGKYPLKRKETNSSRKLAKYDRLYRQIQSYVETTSDIWARLATIEAVLHHKMPSFFWTGVYALVEDELIVRSYQGPVACQKLKHHTGVCWTAVLREETVIVDNVAEFPGHIACNSRSKSEIVIPVRDREGKVFACLDVDSEELEAFDREDELGLKKILSLLFES